MIKVDLTKVRQDKRAIVQFLELESALISAADQLGMTPEAFRAELKLALNELIYQEYEAARAKAAHVPLYELFT